MKKFSKNLCVVTSLVAMLGSIVMPVYASDTVIGEAISNQSNVVSESAILQMCIRDRSWTIRLRMRWRQVLIKSYL